MAKWQSKAAIEEQQYKQWYRQVYPDLKAAIDAYIASYDGIVPDDMKTLSANTVLSRRLAKECVWPLVEPTGAPSRFQSRIVRESIEIAMKPLREAEVAKARAEDRAKREALKNREPAKEGWYRRSNGVGSFVMFPDEARVLLCISSEYVPAEEDYGQDDSGYYQKFALPTPEEEATQEYQAAKTAMDAEIGLKFERQKQFEHRRQTELNAIRASGRDPDWYEELFAGTNL